MYTSYSIEKIASSTRHEALAAAAAAPHRPRVPRAPRRPTPRPESPATGTHPDPPPAPLVRRRRRRAGEQSLEPSTLEPVAPGAAACHDPEMGQARLIGRHVEARRPSRGVGERLGGQHPLRPVSGEAGIGKTRLVAEALDGTGPGRDRPRRDMATGEIPFGVLADTLRDLPHRGARRATPAEREALAPLLPGSAPTGASSGCSSSQPSSTSSTASCADRLLVWVVEDLHWADSATRDMVNLAIRTLRGPFLLVATVRTEDPERPADSAALRPTWQGWHARRVRAPVAGPTQPDEVREQLLDLPGAPCRRSAERIERFSDGVPFVVEELVAAAAGPRGRLCRASPRDDSPGCRRRPDAWSMRPLWVRDTCASVFSSRFWTRPRTSSTPRWSKRCAPGSW